MERNDEKGIKQDQGTRRIRSPLISISKLLSQFSKCYLQIKGKMLAANYNECFYLAGKLSCRACKEQSCYFPRILDFVYEENTQDGSIGK